MSQTRHQPRLEAGLSGLVGSHLPKLAGDGLFIVFDDQRVPLVCS